MTDSTPDRAAPPRQRPFLGCLPLALLVLLLAMMAALAVAFSGWRPLGLGDGPQAGAGDATLLQIRETAELKAATGEFSVPVYLDDDGQTGLRTRIPDFLDGEAIVAIYQGSVDATIDLQGLTQGDVRVDEEGNALALTVPAPVLSSPNIDEEKSRVVTHSRGVLTRLGDAFDDQPLDVKEELDELAVEALTAAAQESSLPETAADNGEAFLVALGESMGYDSVTVTFE